MPCSVQDLLKPFGQILILPPARKTYHFLGQLFHWFTVPTARKFLVIVNLTLLSCTFKSLIQILSEYGIIDFLFRNLKTAIMYFSLLFCGLNMHSFLTVSHKAWRFHHLSVL